MPIQAVTKANNVLRTFFSKQKLQIVSQLDSFLSDLAQEFDRAEDILSELKQSAIKRRKQLEEEHALIQKQQEELTDLRKQVEAFDTRLAQEIKRTKEAVEKELKTQYEHEKALSSQKYESRQTLLQQRIDSLMEPVKSQQQEMNRLNKMLADANTQVTSIAEKAVSQKYLAQSPAAERSGN